MSTAEAAKKIGRTELEIIEWEAGKGTPTLPQLKRLALAYKRPLSVFYLDRPPKDFSLIKDLRRIGGEGGKVYSSRLRYTIRSLQDRQEWLQEFLQKRGYEAVDFVGTAKPGDDPSVVGGLLRKRLGVTTKDIAANSTKDDAFRFWRRRCEASGAFVFLARKIRVDEMRGFALPDPIAPIVAVNAEDSAAGKIFSLLHEMAHLLINAGGVSDRDVRTNGTTPDQKAEVFCNAVAAEALVPLDELRKKFESQGQDVRSFILESATTYRVSEDVIARRLLDIDAISKAEYESIHDEVMRRRPIKKPKRQDKPIQISGDVTALSTVGRYFARVAVSAFHANEISGVDLSAYLGMKLDRLPKLESKLYK